MLFEASDRSKGGEIETIGDGSSQTHGICLFRKFATKPVEGNTMAPLRTMRLVMITSIIWVSTSPAQSVLDGFVLIKGGTFQHGVGANQSGARVRLEDFEILDHPITNQEYKVFVDDTGYPAPLHWPDGKIPQGKEDYPVTISYLSDIMSSRRFVSRFPS